MPAVLITGSSRGLGLEFARQYASEGWNVIATCRAPDKAEELQKLAQRHPTVHIEKLDVADESNITALAKKLKDTAIDVLINNAGILSGIKNPRAVTHNDESQELGTLDPESWERVLRVNSISPIMVTQNFLPHLQRGKGRKVIMVSSTWGSIEQTSPGYIAYRTSKAALNMGMRNVALSLHNDKIIVISVNPGWVQTDMGSRDADLTPKTSVDKMRELINNLTMKQSGQFFRYDGNTIPW